MYVVRVGGQRTAVAVMSGIAMSSGVVCFQTNPSTETLSCASCKMCAAGSRESVGGSAKLVWGRLLSAHSCPADIWFTISKLIQDFIP